MRKTVTMMNALAIALTGLATAGRAQDAVSAVPTFARFDKVEVEDPENPDYWRPSSIRRMRAPIMSNANMGTASRATSIVRAAGAKAPTQSAAQPVSGPPFKHGDIILASPTSMASDWKLCVVTLNAVNTLNKYDLDCGYETAAQPGWGREDPEAP